MPGRPNKTRSWGERLLYLGNISFSHYMQHAGCTLACTARAETPLLAEKWLIFFKIIWQENVHPAENRSSDNIELRVLLCNLPERSPRVAINRQRM